MSDADPREVKTKSLEIEFRLSGHMMPSPPRMYAPVDESLTAARRRR